MKRFDTINVIPFIDVMLVLLAIVLTTATFITQKKLDIQLPDAQAQNAREDQLSVELAIDKKQIIYYEDQAVTISELNKRLSVLAGDTYITLRVDQSVPFNRFVTVIDALKQHQLQNLSILTKGKISVAP